MKTIFKILLLILSISLVNCEKNDFYTVELENEPAIVRKITGLQDYYNSEDIEDELFYLELVNEHAKLYYTTLNVDSTVDGHEYLDEFFEQYKKEDLAVKISGIVVVDKKKLPFGKIPFLNGINFHTLVLRSIKTDE